MYKTYIQALYNDRYIPIIVDCIHVLIDNVSYFTKCLIYFRIFIHIHKKEVCSNARATLTRNILYEFDTRNKLSVSKNTMVGYSKPFHFHFFEYKEVL